MNRRERRAQASRGNVSISKMPTDAKHLLNMHCAGLWADPKQDCSLSISVPLPINAEQLRNYAWATHGWFVTTVTAHGETPICFSLLCPTCAEALIPDLVEYAKKHMPARA